MCEFLVRTWRCAGVGRVGVAMRVPASDGTGLGLRSAARVGSTVVAGAGVLGGGDGDVRCVVGWTVGSRSGAGLNPIRCSPFFGAAFFLPLV